MTAIQNFFQNLLYQIPKIGISDIIDILVVSFLIYTVLRLVRSSSAARVAWTVLVLLIATWLTSVFDLYACNWILNKILELGFISLVVIFQPEIRRVLSQVGAFGYFDRPKYAADGSATPEFIVQTIVALADRRIGALIAFERGISLRGYEATGVALDAMLSRELVETIFTPPLPLHDGGMTLRNGRIAATHCVFPVSNNPELISSGMRHRAAVGLSEETDALVIVVSEETGSVSVAHNGKLIRYTGDQRATSLIRWVSKAMPEGSKRRKGLAATIFGRLSGKGKGK